MMSSAISDSTPFSTQLSISMAQLSPKMPMPSYRALCLTGMA